MMSFNSGSRRIRWLIGFLSVGLLLGLLLVWESVASFRHVSGRLIPDHLEALAGRHVSEIEDSVLRLDPENGEQLSGFLNEFLSGHAGDIAWIRVAEQSGETVAVAGNPAEKRIAEPIIRDLLDRRTQRVSRKISTPGGSVQQVFLPFRFRFPADRTGPAVQRDERSRPRFKLVEMALYLHGKSDPFFPLVRSLVISIAGALALVACIVTIGISLRRYVTGQRLMQQLAVARTVQQAFLPSECPDCEDVESAAEYVPNAEVSGDYYNLFPHQNGHLTAVLGDVSGKGLPAALVVGLLHGAIRLASSLDPGKEHGELAAGLNRLLLSCTSAERFVTLFWARYSREDRRLSYVNCGHPPALLLRWDSGRDPVIERLGAGGPVLGLLPGLLYRGENVTLQQGDLLVICSDGVLEAANSKEVEFGEERLVRILSNSRDCSAKEIAGKVVEEVRRFSGRSTYEDDLTLMVLRF